jgi:hypothetical protein
MSPKWSLPLKFMAKLFLSSPWGLHAPPIILFLIAIWYFVQSTGFEAPCYVIFAWTLPDYTCVISI